jgi:predicted porin
MKKTLISAAVALGFVGAAQAQMTIYGLVDMSYGKSLATELSAPKQKSDFHSGGDNFSSEGNSTTRIGIKGSTDLGSGIKGNFRFETGGITSDGRVGSSGRVDPNDPNGNVVDDTPFFNRQAWAGFSGAFGEVRLGRQDSVTFQTMIDFDFNGASNGLSAGAYTGVGVFNQGRQSRSLQYITPSFGGFTGQVGFQPKGNQPSNSPVKNVFSAGAKYATGPLAVGASFQSKGTSTTKAFGSIGGSYDFTFVKVMLGYADGGKIADGGIGSGPSLGVNVPIAGWNIGAHVANNRDKGAKLTAIELWVNKEIFKNTYAYFEAGNIKTSVDNATFGNDKDKGSGYAAGVIWVF